MNMKLVREKLLESPDRIIVNGVKHSYDDDDNIAFIAWISPSQNKIIDVMVSQPGHDHSDLESATTRDFYQLKKKIDDLEKEFHGRLFTNEKIITFWYYPTSKQFVTMLQIISEKSGINFSDWKVEVFPDTEKGNVEKRTTTRPGEFIPVKDYIGSADAPEEDYARHIQSPIKGKKKVPVGYGSKNPKYQDKRAWQMASLTSESLNEGEKEFWNEELDMEDRFDITTIVREVYLEYGRNSRAAQFKLKKLLRPIYDFSDNFIKWLLSRQEAEKERPYDRSANKKHYR